MKNFIFKSIETDLQKIHQSLDIIQKNVLYLTYRMDTVTKYLSKERTDTRLQKQVDEYFEKDPFGSAFVASQDDIPPEEEPKRDLD